MAEIGVVASVIAVIQIADRVVERCKFYIESLSDAPSDIRVILIEVSTLKTLFENLKFLIAPDNSASEILKLLSDRNGPVEGCLGSITELEKLFPYDSVHRSDDSTNRSKKRKLNVVFATLAWPLKASRAQRLLEQIVRYKTSVSLVLTTELIQDIKNIQKKNSEIHNILTDSQRQDVYKWLQHTDPSPLHNKACKQYETGTGNWMLRSLDWTKWLDAQYRCLWIHGIPGAGKTILASFLIKQINRKCNEPLNGKIFYAYYYCYFGRNQDEATPFIRWILCQLCRQVDFIPGEVQKLHKIAGEPSLEELLTAVEAVLQNCELVYVVIDALDESSPRSDLLKIIRDLATDARFSKIQILATSRDYIDIERTMENISTSVTMTNPLVEEDIRILVKSHLSSDEGFKRWPKDLLDEVEETVTTGAKGMFRWAVCQLDVLQRLKRERTIIKKTLDTLPKTLDETYERMYLSIPREEWPIVHHALQWIHYHNELYSGEGIPCSILLDAIQNTVDPFSEVSRDRFYDIHRLRELCGCLISVMTEDENQQRGSLRVDRVTFAHYTVREYLDATRISKSPVAYFAICTKAVNQKFTEIVILQAQNIANMDWILRRYSPESETEVYDKLHRDFVFYCVASAIFSLAVLQEDIYQLDKFSDVVKEFLDPSKPYFDSIYLAATFIHQYTDFLEIAEIDSEFGFSGVEWQTDPKDTDAAVLLYLLLFSRFSAPVLARSFLEQKDDRRFLSSHLNFSKVVWFISGNDSESYEFNASIIGIMAQLAFQNQATFELMLDYGVGHFDPSNILLSYIGSRDGDTALLLRLLQAGADPNVEGYRISPLQIATVSWDYAGVEILLQAGADPNYTGDTDGVEWEVKTLLSQFNYLHGSSPLYICRNFDCIFEDERKEERASNVEIIESLFLSHGGIEIEGYWKAGKGEGG